MKIHAGSIDFNLKREYVRADAGSEPRPVFKKASGGEDFLEISDEAVKRFSEARILSFEDGRAKRLAGNSAAASEKPLNENRAALMKEKIMSGGYDFDSPEILGETAERIIGLLG